MSGAHDGGDAKAVDGAAPRATRSRRARIARGVLYTLGGLFVALLLAIGIGAWLLGRETTLQRIVAAAERSLKGQLVVTGITGSLYERIAFERLVYHTRTQVITVENGALRYVLAPISRALTISDAHAASVTVETIVKSDEPLKEPDTLELPAEARLDTLRLDTLRVDVVRIVQGASTTELTGVEARARYESKRWIVERVALISPWGVLSGRAALDATRPFALEGQVLAEGRMAEVPYRAPLLVRGRLGDLKLASDFTLSDRAGTTLAGIAAASVLTFREQPIERANVHLAGVSPKRWKPDLPEADLSIDLNVVPSIEARGASSRGKNPFHGSARIVNAMPGAIDRDRIPVRTLETEFTGDAAMIAFASLTADLGAAGKLAGRGSYVFADGGTPSLDVVVRGLDLKAIHGKLIASRFAGPLKISRSAGILKVDAALTEPGRSVRVKAEEQGDEVRIAEAAVALGSSRVSASGRVGLAGARAFALTGNASHLNPRDFGDFPKADLNGDFKLNGVIGASPASGKQAAWRVAADVRVAPSRLMDRALAGTIRGTASRTEVRGADVALSFGTNRVSGRGDFGRPNDSLAWTIDAPRLAELGFGLGGRVIGHGSIAGTLASPALDFTLAGDDLRYARASGTASTGAAKAPSQASDAVTYSLKSLRAKGRLMAGANGAVDVDVALAEFRDGSAATAPTVAAASLKVKGTRSAHRMTVAASATQFDFSAGANGGLDAKYVWRGAVESFASRGRVPFHTVGSTALVAGVDRAELGRTVLQFSDGSAEIDRFVYAGGRLTTSGRATGVPLDLVGTFSREFAHQVRTSLKLGAEWDVRVDSEIDGKLHVFRESGDVQFLGEPRFALAFDNLDVAAVVVASRVSANLDAAGNGFGSVKASAETRVSKRASGWGIAGDAPLQLKSDIDIPDMRWLGRLSGRPGLDLSGRLRVVAAARGTVANPSLSGSAKGEAIALRWPDQGLNFRDGKLDADFVGDRIVLKQASLASLGSGSDGGRMNASGDLRLFDQRVIGALAIKFDKFEALSRTDRTMVVSGSGAARFGTSGIDVSADLKADRGVLQLAERRGPVMSDDIVIIGRPHQDQPVRKNLPVRFEVRFDMGDDFKVRGSGFEGRLGGVMRVTGDVGALRAIGTVEVREGTYVAYGQKLTIERGNLTFSGPIDNPGLDILAVRKNLAVEAGVLVTGTALSPQARLTSNPGVPDTEKLSWLVLGHGLEAAGKADYATLATAAASLFGSSDSASIQSRIAATLGVDEVGVSGLGSEKGGMLTIGKQISSRLRVSFEQGFQKAATLLKIRYNIYKRVDLQVQTGTESAVDVFYTFSFD